MDTNFIRDIVDDYDVVVGNTLPTKPDYVHFKNWKEALYLLWKHINNKNSGIIIHADVDLDGIGAAYVVRTALCDYGCVGRVTAVINSIKEHGMSQAVVDYINKLNIGLFIIVDSSSNDMEYIKQFNCDVLVLDHHVVSHTESLVGRTANGNYVIVNNMVDNPQDNYKAESEMSGALVAYEVLRLYERETRMQYSSLENRLLYQWVGCTLISDCIKTGNNRNQWYMQNTVCTMSMEPTLKILKDKLDAWTPFLTKSFIGFKLAPTFNKAIRAGACVDALRVALGTPQDVESLSKYGDIQNEIKSRAMNRVQDTGGLALRPLDTDGSEANITSSYSGIIASTVLETINKSSIAYTDKGSYIKGSFRGKIDGMNYRKIFEENGFFAQGHETAFGIEVDKSEINRLSALIEKIEQSYIYRPYLTMFNIRSDIKGIHHIDDFESFRKSGGFAHIAIANSTLSNREQINLVMTKEHVKVTAKHDKYMNVAVETLTGKSFETDINTPFVKMYLEYGKDIGVYIRNNNQVKE